MLYIIKTSTLLGQSIIAYLQQKGFPEVCFHSVIIALLAVLIIEFGNLDRIALRTGYEHEVRASD